MASGKGRPDMSIALLPAPRPHQATMAHTLIIAQAIRDWEIREYNKAHPVTRAVYASETITTTTRTVIAVETTNLASKAINVRTDPGDIIDGDCREI